MLSLKEAEAEAEAEAFARLAALAVYASLFVIELKLRETRGADKLLAAVAKLALINSLVLVVLESDGVKSVTFQNFEYTKLIANRFEAVYCIASAANFRSFLCFLCELICSNAFRCNKSPDLSADTGAGNRLCTKLSSFCNPPLAYYKHNVMVCCYSPYDNTTVRSVAAKLLLLR